MAQNVNEKVKQKPKEIRKPSSHLKEVREPPSNKNKMGSWLSKSKSKSQSSASKSSQKEVHSASRKQQPSGQQNLRDTPFGARTALSEIHTDPAEDLRKQKENVERNKKQDIYPYFRKN